MIPLPLGGRSIVLIAVVALGVCYGYDRYKSGAGIPKLGRSE